MSEGGAAFHWGWLVLFVRALAQNDAAPLELVLVKALVDKAGVMVCYICTSQCRLDFSEAYYQFCCHYLRRSSR